MPRDERAHGARTSKMMWGLVGDVIDRRLQQAETKLHCGLVSCGFIKASDGL